MKQTRRKITHYLLLFILFVPFTFHTQAQSYEKTWMPNDPTYINLWTKSLIKEVKKNPQELIPSIQNFKDMVEADPVLEKQIKMMFKESIKMRKKTPLGTPQVKNFDQFLNLLNAIMQKEPEFLECVNDTTGALSPSGLLGFWIQIKFFPRNLDIQNNLK